VEPALQRLSTQLQTAAEVSRAASSILDPDELIQQVVDLVCARFALYYAGLFLVDEAGEWAVLRAGSGKAGRRMAEQGHRSKIGGNSVIGWCVANVQARIALDVGEEAVRFENPLLPKTRSELALPLISRGKILGAMTIQSAQEAAFFEEDIAVLQTMADQLANAIENARLYDQLQRELADRKQAQEALREAQDEPEIRVAERTAELKAANERLQREINEREQVEAALRESEERFRAIFESATDCILVWDRGYNCLYANQAAIDHAGTTREELRRHNIYGGSASPPSLIRAWASRLDQVFETGESLHVEDFMPVGQSIAYCESNLSPMEDGEGNVFAVGVVYRDVTERKRMEAALRQSEERFKAQYRGLPVPTFTWQKFGDRFVLVDYNDAAVAITEGRISACVGMEAREMYSDNPEMLEELSRCFAEKANVKRDETYQIRSMAKDRHFSVSYAFVPPDLILIHTEDVTERKRAEEGLRETMAELERSNKELEQFAYIASHDLQEPLRAVSSYVQLLERRYKGKLDADADRFIARTVAAAARMQTLINSVLAYSRLGTHGKPFEPTDCEAILNQALANLQTAVEESGATVTHDPLPTLYVDGQQMIRLFQNLIENGIKFRSDEPPRIHITAERLTEQNEWLFSVRDNGIGIEPQYAERIFRIFQRLHTRQKYPGTGIGLALCRRIVERHGGRIWVESGLGKGATFLFTLPHKGGD
jgi:PAS domain S-box-containing protein